MWGNVFSQYIWPTVSLNSYLGLEDMLMYKFNAQLIALGMIIGSIGILLFSFVYNYIRGIDYMKENHPEYNGEDLFDEDTNKNKIQ